MNSGQKLWEKAKSLIPGGNMLLSKRSEMFLPEMWPSYFSKAKGCHVWDLDGQRFTDMSIMGIGTNTLGYGNELVDNSVKEVILRGNMSSLNCPEEVYLAERLIELHPWANMVRFARSGGEANAIAIRIARAAAGKGKVAICGYHGWHDWYLSVNINTNDGLKEHLLPGLEPNGVPKELEGSVIPFEYNNIEQLKDIIHNNEDIGVIKMEVTRNQGPSNNYLKEVRDLANKKNIVLIFDECTSGFRETFGGIHKKFGVEPDMAVFGKALGNGYAITAVIGKKEVMEAAQSTFISSTFWTERIGPSAALATLKTMEESRSWEVISVIGKKIREGWKKLAIKNSLNITISGIPAISSFSFNTNQNNLIYKTYLTQEMLKRGFLASNLIYVCTCHNDEVISQYFENLSYIFRVISECENADRSAVELLDGPICHSGFKRLN